MNIGGASRKTGLRAKTIRYYEDIGLVRPARSENGYRSYAANDIHDLRPLQRARSLGFTVEECRQLLSLYHDRTRASSDFLKTHKATGLVVFALTILRLLWWMQRPAPAEPPGSGLERVAASLVHATLHLMLIATPVTGLAMMGSAGASVSIYGLVDVPPIFPENDLMDQLVSLHGWLAYTFGVLILLHLMATAFHVCIRRGGTLKRMTD